VSDVVRAQEAVPVGAARTVVIGVGNCYRRDDGIGPAAAAEIERQHLPGVRVVICDGEPAGLLEAWAGMDLAIVVDAVRCVPGTPGRMHRWPAGQLERGWTASSHGLGIPDALALGRALDRCPHRVVLFAVEAADLRPGGRPLPGSGQLASGRRGGHRHRTSRGESPARGGPDAPDGPVPRAEN
jgi:hydrogenase maturation protease